MSSKKRVRAKDDVASAPKRNSSSNNYYYPLQVLDKEVDKNQKTDDTGKETPKKKHIPPITIIKATTEQIHEVCKLAKVIQYSIRKISIGHKLFCEYQFDFDNLIKSLRVTKFQYFSYTAKNNRPFKVVLSGLDKTEPDKVKSDLLELGLPCHDVKLVERKSKYDKEIILYIVYLTKGMFSLNELREKFNVINYIRVKWSYQSKSPNKITQCHNCQMFGHGSNNCNINTFCAKCGGQHATSTCKETLTKCANCGGEHISSDSRCPSRASYINLRNRYSNAVNRKTTPQKAPILNPQQPMTNSWSNVVRSNGVLHSAEQKNDMFSVEELKNMTFELISLLRNCRSKLDQFNAVTTLAFKFI